jgi:hypothetical protein
MEVSIPKPMLKVTTKSLMAAEAEEDDTPTMESLRVCLLRLLPTGVVV